MTQNTDELCLFQYEAAGEIVVCRCRSQDSHEATCFAAQRELIPLSFEAALRMEGFQPDPRTLIAGMLEQNYPLVFIRPPPPHRSLICLKAKKDPPLRMQSKLDPYKITFVLRKISADDASLVWWAELPESPQAPTPADLLERWVSNLHFRLERGTTEANLILD
jgi:hypothetical protein